MKTLHLPSLRSSEFDKESEFQCWWNSDKQSVQEVNSRISRPKTRLLPSAWKIRNGGESIWMSNTMCFGSHHLTSVVVHLSMTHPWLFMLCQLPCYSCSVCEDDEIVRQITHTLSQKIREQSRTPLSFWSIVGQKSEGERHWNEKQRIAVRPMRYCSLNYVSDESDRCICSIH